MKRTLYLAIAALLALSLLTACADGGGNGGISNNDSDAANQPGPISVPEPESEAENEDNEDNEGNDVDDDIEEIDADAWWLWYHWRLETKIDQKEEFGALLSMPGMYADYYYSVVMWGGGDITKDNADSITGVYAYTVESVITIDTDEAADRLLSEMLGGDISGMDLGIDVELAGAFKSAIPYYYDDDGYPVTPPYDYDANTYVWPDGKEDVSSYGFVHKVDQSWQSPIKDKNGLTVQPAVGSYLMFDALKIEYIGTSSHALVGSFDEDIWYDLYLYVVIEPGSPGMDLGDFNAKIYINLTTTEHHNVWLEGDGTLFLVERLDEMM